MSSIQANNYDPYAFRPTVLTPEQQVDLSKIVDTMSTTMLSEFGLLSAAVETPKTLGELAKNDFKAITDKPTTEAYRYLFTLAQATTTDISGWTTDLLATVDLTNKRKLNKFFFDKQGATAVDPAVAKKNAEMVEELVNYAGARISTRKNSRVRTLETSIANNLRSMSDYQHSITDYIKSIHVYREELLQLRDKPCEDYVREELLKLLSNKFFTLASRRELKLVFHTPPVILPASKGPIPMGTYQVTLHLGEGTVYVQALKDNLHFSGYYHPYISSHATICWGNAGNTANRLLSEGRYGSVFEILASLLTGYDVRTTPYVAMEDFQRQWEEQNGVRPADAAVSAECPTCGIDQNLNDCECQHCEACDVAYNPDNGCGGNYCDPCGECVGTSHCETHYCGICGDDAMDDDDHGCCTFCDSTERRITQHGHRDHCERPIVESTVATNATNTEGETF